MASPTPQTNAFDSIYRTQTPDGSAVSRAGWDIGEPQPVVIELERAGRLRGKVLDIGCGTGENALYLASRGYSVVGLDGSAGALVHARAKARRRGIHAVFAQADARELTGFSGQFDTVIDSGLLHTFSDADRTRYLGALGRSCRPGARVHILAISDAAPLGPGPRRLTEQQLRESFTSGWDIEELRRVHMRGKLPGYAPAELPSWLLIARRQTVNHPPLSAPK